MWIKGSKFLKIYMIILLFVGSLFLWNCESSEDLSIQENYQGYELIKQSEAQSIINNIIETKKIKRGQSQSIDIDNSSLSFIDVKNTNLSLPIFSASWNEDIKTKVFLVKKEGVVYPCLYHLVPFKEEKLDENLFSGGIIITTIDNEFINGYKVKQGVIIAKYKRKNSNTLERVRTMDDSDFDCTDAAWCDTLDEVVISSSGSGGSSSSSGSGYINISIGNPVSTQGWTISLSGDNGSGGGGGGSSSSNSNSGDGGGSGDDGVPLFDCDNPTPNGCEDTWPFGEEIVVGPDTPINDVRDFLKCFDSTQSATLTVYVNEPNPGTGDSHKGTFVGHTFVSIKQGSNISTYGYYPVSNHIYPTVNNSSSAVIGDDGNGNEPFSANISITVTGNQLQQILDASINFNQTYHLDTYNCTDFAIELGNLAGMNLPESNGTWPGGGGSNPGALGQYIRNQSSSNNIATNTTGGNAPATNKGC